MENGNIFLFTFLLRFIITNEYSEIASNVISVKLSEIPLFSRKAPIVIKTGKSDGIKNNSMLLKLIYGVFTLNEFKSFLYAKITKGINIIFIDISKGRGVNGLLILIRGPKELIKKPVVNKKKILNPME